MTAYVVKMDDPSLPQGATVQVMGIGILTNGQETFVTEEQAELFRHMDLVPAENEGDEPELGPTVLQYLSGNDKFEVRVAEKGEEEKFADPGEVPAQDPAPPPSPDPTPNPEPPPPPDPDEGAESKGSKAKNKGGDK